MRYRPSTQELIYTLAEFSELSAAEVCRRYNIGDDWVDASRNEAAEKELSGASHRGKNLWDSFIN